MTLRGLMVLMMVVGPACAPKGDAGESSSTSGGSETGGDTVPTGSDTGPSVTAGTTADTDAPTSTVTAADTTAGTGEPLNCNALVEREACEAADCAFISGTEVFVDGDGCHFGAPTGFCVDSWAGFGIATMYYGPGPDPQVVDLFDEALPNTLPDGWKECDCGDPDAPLACACLPTGEGCGAKLAAHCATLTDEATCTQFDANDHLIYGCLWIEPRVQEVVDATCSAEPLPGRCITKLSAGCEALMPPASCSPEDAEKRPYALQLEDDKVAIVDDIPCNAIPGGMMFECWNGQFNIPECECPCLPTL